MDFRFGFAIGSYAKTQNFRSIGAMKLFLWPIEDRRLGQKNISVSRININLRETPPPPPDLIYMENADAFLRKTAKFRPLQIMLPEVLES